MRNNIGKLTKIALTCAIMCIAANIYVPLAVPVTLQTLVLYFSLLLLGAMPTLTAVGLYLVLGAIGLPVFSGFSGGIGRLLDASGGYMIGMLLAVLLWWLLDKALPDMRNRSVLLSSVTLLLIYIIGSLWYALVYLGGAEHIPEALLVGVLPFIIPDALKIWVAHLLAKRLKNVI